MKRMFGIALGFLVLASCGTTSADSEIAARYDLTTEQVKEMRQAAEGMGMSLEDHLELMGFTQTK